MNDDGARPEFLGTHPRVVDCRCATHPGRLRGIGIQLIRLDDPNAVMAPL
jgi:hypothetical protein